MNITRRAFSLTAPALAAAPLLRTGSARSADTADVVIIGGGLSGLNAAWMLDEAGYDVVVLEGAARLGGRIWSASEVETKPELGASQIGPSYARVLDAIDRLGLRLIDEDRVIFPFTYYLDGQTIRAKEWADHPGNRTVGDERKIAPVQIAGALLSKLNPMRELDDWLSPEFRKFDVSVADLFKTGGVSPAAQKLAALTQDMHQVSALGVMQESFRTIYESRFSRRAGSSSFPMRAQTEVINAAPQPQASSKSEKWPKNIVGGTWELPRAIASRLRRRPLTNRQVVAIEMDGDGVDVRCLDGSNIRAKYAISAVPFSTLRNIFITPAPNAVQADGIFNLQYQDTTRAFGWVKQPYWEKDGLDPSVFTDSPLRMMWVLDNHKGGKGPYKCMFVMTWQAAEQVGSLSPAEGAAYLVSELARIRPASKGQVSIIKFHSWRQQMLQRGCRHNFRPGQIAQFAVDMIKPISRLHIAGEHTRRLEQGMESAMESGERAAQEVLGRL